MYDKEEKNVSLSIKKKCEILVSQGYFQLIGLSNKFTLLVFLGNICEKKAWFL